MRRVYVTSIQFTGLAEVLQVRRGDKLRVETPTGRTHIVRADQCRDLDRKPDPLPVLDTPPRDEHAGGAPQPKDPPWRSERYRTFVRELPCCVCGALVDIEASHHPEEGGGTMAMKCPDDRCAPLCKHHHARHHARPYPREDVECWVAATREAWPGELPS